MVKALVMVGNGDNSEIVCTPLPGILKWIASPALASRIAWRSEPAPLSLAFRTVRVLGRKRSSRDSRNGRFRRVIGARRIPRPEDLDARSQRRKAVANMVP